MSNAFTLQDPGEGIHEAEILEVHVAEGQSVEESDPLLTVETDKAAVEIPSPFTGDVLEVLVEVGETVRVGEPLLTYSTDGEAPSDDGERAEKGADHQARRGEPPADGAKDREAPAAATVADQQVEAAPEDPDSAARDPRPDRSGPVPASPVARKLARDLGVELGQVEASGPGGRVTRDDVRAAAGEADERSPGRASEDHRDASRTVGPRWLPGGVEALERRGPIERRPWRSIRRRTAERMALAWARIPHVTHADVADITALEEVRADHRESVRQEGGELTLTVLVLKAVVAALKEHPSFNACLDEERDELILLGYYDLGVAVDTDRGLLVPVVRRVDAKSLSELARELSTLARRARAGTLEREEMSGATFTITNPGPIGGTGFTPIINPPQAAILGMAQARPEPTVRDGQIVPRLMLPLCLAFDHRINDGAGAARFARRIVALLEDPDALIRHL